MLDAESCHGHAEALLALTYKASGVDIAEGDRFVEAIKPLCSSTKRPEVIDGIGGFAGLFALGQSWRDPVLVAGTDGVGTKLKTALASGKHDTIGIDLVAMAVNDVIVTGAEPLFFLDYFATSRLEADVATQVVVGIAQGCKESGCALLGGETAELPGMYTGNDYDLAGFCVGVVERDDLRDGTDVRNGDAVIGLLSSGLHSNGHTLARQVILEVLGHALSDAPAQLRGASIGDELLRPTKIYVGALRSLTHAGVRFKGAAHITGGGLPGNAGRMLRDKDLAIHIDPTTWDVPPIFDLIANAGVADDEMRRTFNLGIGMVVVCAAEDADDAIAALRNAGESPRVVGRVVPRVASAVSFG